MQDEVYFAAGAVWPDTGATVFVKMQAGGAGDLDGFAVDAVVEDVADGRFRMSEEAVSPRTLLRRLRWL